MLHLHIRCNVRVVKQGSMQNNSLVMQHGGIAECDMQHGISSHVKADEVTLLRAYRLHS